MKYIIYALLTSCLIGFRFPVAAGLRMTDFFCGALAVIGILNYLKGRWKIDNFLKYTSTYAAIMFFASILNGTLVNTIFLNYFRIYIEGLIVYFCTYNAIKKGKDLNIIIYFLLCYLLFFAADIKNLMMTSFEVSDYHTLTNEIDYGRNSWGFTGLLFGVAASFLFFSGKVNKLAAVIIVTFSFLVIILSISRFSTISFVLISLFYAFIYKGSISYKNFLKLALSITVAIFLFSYLQSFVSADIFDSEIEYLYEKIDGASDDFKESRLKSINILPISEFLNRASFTNIIIGDGLYIGHSVIAHTFISTGFIGMIYYLFFNIRLIITNYKRGIYGKIIAMLVFLMFANDFVTNSRFIILVNNCFFMIIAAYMRRTNELEYKQK